MLLLVNAYFAAVGFGRWPGLRAALARLFGACGVETDSCAIVAKTSYARMFGGLPNVCFGIAWCLALFALAGHWVVQGRADVPWPFLAVAAASLAAGFYLVHALVVVLKQPCPL